jgi:hypothetical protein
MRERRLAKRRKAVAGDVVPSVRRGDDEIDEGPSEADLERFGGVTQTCPECGTELYDDVGVCWNCGTPVGIGRRKSRGGPWAAIVVALILIAFILYFVL